MASSRLREHGSRLPVSWDRGGTITEGARAEGCRLQVAERPRGVGRKTVSLQWGQSIPFRIRGS